MAEATHFIEVFKAEGECWQQWVRPINALTNELNATLIQGFETIAIFKIKPKTNV